MLSFDSRPENVVAIKRIHLIREHTQRGMRQALFAVGKDYIDTANTNILARPRSGRVYRIRSGSGGRTRKHTASRPGESHANMTGALRRSMGWKVRGSRQLEFGYGATQATTDYARRIELGGGNIKPRPSLRIAIKQNRRNTMNNIERHARRSFGI